MSKLFAERMSAEIEGDFVVFLIGMRINKLWKVHKWWPVFSAMPKMIKELEANPELGMLGHIMGLKVIVQYWRSFDHLEAYARRRDNAHLPAWKAFNESVGKSRGDVGIWHETYQVRAGEYEAVYSGMPQFGLGTASALVSGARDVKKRRVGDSCSSRMSPHHKSQERTVRDRLPKARQGHAATQGVGCP